MNHRQNILLLFFCFQTVCECNHAISILWCFAFWSSIMFIIFICVIVSKFKLFIFIALQCSISWIYQNLLIHTTLDGLELFLVYIPFFIVDTRLELLCYSIQRAIFVLDYMLPKCLPKCLCQLHSYQPYVIISIAPHSC